MVPVDGSPPLDWWVAADDRWHTPATEPSCRQYRLLGTPVVETVVGVPGGDVVHRVYAVADGGGVPVRASARENATATGRDDRFSSSTTGTPPPSATA